MKVRIDPLDKLFSQFIRKRAVATVGGCEKCLRPKFDIHKDNGDIFPAWKQLETSHFYGREEQSVRFDEDNAIGICFHCHQYLGSHPAEHAEFFKKRLGDGYDLLEGRMRITYPKPDREAIALYLKVKIREIDEAKD